MAAERVRRSQRAENGTTVTTVTATDPDSVGTLTYAIVGGADAARFAINAATGVLTFVAPPDFEAPADAGADNVYDVIVRVSDGVSTDDQALAVTLTNSTSSPPSSAPNGGGASAALSLAENGTAVTTVTPPKPMPARSSPTASSAAPMPPASRSTPATGVLTFVAPPDFEAPADAGADCVYRRDRARLPTAR